MGLVRDRVREDAPEIVKTIGGLVDGLPDVTLTGNPRTPLTGIMFDSRTVLPGMLFVALRGGYVDGHQFLPEARAARAVAALVEPDTPDDLLDGYDAVVRVPNTRVALAQVATRWYDNPSGDLTLIGVTGTDGKTTTCYLIESMLNENGISSGLIGTVGVRIPGRSDLRSAVRQTTPESLDIQRYLSGMRAAGAWAAVLETTSHGLEMHRVDCCQYDIGVVTNVTHEHLDFHGTLEGYRDAKAGLLRRVVEAGSRGKHGTCVLNLDDEGTRAIASAGIGAQILWFSAEGNQAADVWADAIETWPDGCRFELHTPVGSAGVELRLPGSWNVANGLAAATVGHALGLPPCQIARGIGALSAVPGRMERVDAGQPFTMLVDYAHTPGALRLVLDEVRRLTAGRVLTLIGSAGERDLAKRPLLGAAAQELADFAIFTSDDPRFEDPDAIIAAIAAGAERAGGRRGADFECIEDRRAAISELINRARPGDVVVLAGKGHELSQIYGDTLCPWDDAAVARDALQDVLQSV